MEKISMENVSNELLLEFLKENDLVEIPDVVTVGNYNVGNYENSAKELKAWANLEVTDSRKLELLESVGLIENAKFIKLKLVNYQGEALNHLLNKDILTDNFALEFTKDRYGNITGLVFKTSLSEIKGV